MSLSVSEPGPKGVAARSSGIGEKAIAIATASAATRVFLMCIFEYLPIAIRDTAIAREQELSPPARARQRRATLENAR